MAGMNAEDEKYQYKAFISYSHSDAAAVRWLHQRVETYRTPKQLHGRNGEWGEVPARLTPVFRDRDELTSSGGLGGALETALAGSEFLIVACSPSAAASRWVNEEIRAFRKTHPAARVLPIVVDGDPGAAVGEGLTGCFPPALTEPEQQGGAPIEPIAADMRPQADGKRFAFQKLAAGLLGVGLDDLVQREAHRRQRRLTVIAAASTLMTVGAVALSLFAFDQRDEANRQRAIAEHQYETATAALDYLVGIFEIANPATENPKTITALTILERGQSKLEEGFADNPDVKAKLLGAIGDVYANLGELEKAEATLREAVKAGAGTVEDRLANKLALTALLTRTINLEEAQKFISNLEEELVTISDKKLLPKGDVFFYRGLLTAQKGAIAQQKNLTADAIILFGAAREILGGANRDVRSQIARVSSTRGMLLASEKRIDEAMADLEIAKSTALEMHGPDHLETATAVHNIAYTYSKAGMYDEAVEHMSQSVAIFKKVLEPNHPFLSSAQLLMGRTQQAKGQYAEAVRFLKESLETARRAYGDDHEIVGFGLLYLSLAEADAGAPADALSSLDEAGQIYDKNFEAGDFNHGDLLVYRAIVLGKAGRVADAKPLCEEGMAMLKSNLGEGHTYLAEMAEQCTAATG